MDDKTRAAVSQFIEQISTQYDVAGFILFGSRVHDDFRPDSDADVAVLIKGNHGDFITTKLAMADIAFDVLLETGVRIQPLPIWEDEWEHPESYSNPRLLENIEREGVRL
ncbi:nucleotidyltransferase domain-containing protein [Marinobacteraceae bacterium S3BR75-40.1]